MYRCITAISIATLFALQLSIAEEYDRSLYSGEVEAVLEQFLLSNQDYQILKNTRSIETSSMDEQFATCLVELPKQTKKFYLLKEQDRWVVFPKIPSHKDNLYVLNELAKEYLSEHFKNLYGYGFADSSFQNKDPKSREINYKIRIGNVSSEKVKGPEDFVSKRCMLHYQYSDSTGWAITNHSMLE